MPRKLIAAQAVVVVGLVVLVYITLLRPDPGGPPRVVDAPGETQAQVPGGPGSERPNGSQGEANENRGSSTDGLGSPRSEADGAAGATSPGAPLLPGQPGFPDQPGSPPDSSDPSPPGFGGEGGYGPGDDQYGNSLTRLEERIGLGSGSPSP